MKKTAILTLLGFTALTACRKDEIEGPELRDIFGDFAIVQELTSDRTTVDFAAGETVTFFAELTIRTDWEIIITGQTTGARRVIEGRARDIDGNVANWNGNITFAPLFTEELCSTVMVFKDYPDTLFGPDITILAKKPADDIDLLISDFEDQSQAFNAFAEQAATNQLIAGPSFISNIGGDPPFFSVDPAENNGWWRMDADNSNAAIFICGVGMSAVNAQGNNGAPYFQFGTNNPDNIYFNAFINGYGRENTTFTINFQEDDNLDGTYVASQEGAWGTSIPVDWVGWKLVSIPMSDMQLSTVGGFGNIDGTGQQDMDRIISMEFLLLSDNGVTGLTGYALDFCNFTYFTPWEP